MLNVPATVMLPLAVSECTALNDPTLKFAPALTFMFPATLIVRAVVELPTVNVPDAPPPIVNPARLMFWSTVMVCPF